MECCNGLLFSLLSVREENFDKNYRNQNLHTEEIYSDKSLNIQYLNVKKSY